MIWNHRCARPSGYPSIMQKTRAAQHPTTTQSNLIPSSSNYSNGLKLCQIKWVVLFANWTILLVKFPLIWLHLGLCGEGFQWEAKLTSELPAATFLESGWCWWATWATWAATFPHICPFNSCLSSAGLVANVERKHLNWIWKLKWWGGCLSVCSSTFLSHVCLGLAHPVKMNSIWKQRVKGRWKAPVECTKERWNVDQTPPASPASCLNTSLSPHRELLIEWNWLCPNKKAWMARQTGFYTISSNSGVICSDGSGACSSANEIIIPG